MSDQEKLCINCHWYNARQSCQAPQNGRWMRHVKQIDGNDRPLWSYRWFTYEYLRKNGWLVARLMQQCGREGRWWRERQEKVLRRPEMITRAGWIND